MDPDEVGLELGDARGVERRVLEVLVVLRLMDLRANPPIEQEQFDRSSQFLRGRAAEYRDLDRCQVRLAGQLSPDIPTLTEQKLGIVWKREHRGANSVYARR